MSPTINFNPRTTPIALVGIGGAIIIAVILTFAVWKLDVICAFIFTIIGLCILGLGVYLFAYSIKLHAIWNFS